MTGLGKKSIVEVPQYFFSISPYVYLVFFDVWTFQKTAKIPRCRLYMYIDVSCDIGVFRNERLVTEEIHLICKSKERKANLQENHTYKI